MSDIGHKRDILFQDGRHRQSERGSAHDSNGQVKIRLLCDNGIAPVGVAHWCQLMESRFGSAKYQDC